MSSNNGMEMNKIAAAILLAGLIGMVAGKASEFLYYGGPKHAGGHHEEKRGFSIEVTEDTSGGAAAPSGPPDIAALYPTADIAAGKDYFGKKCATCHHIDSGNANAIGPGLHGVVGRDIASHAGFSYSDGLKKHAGSKWDFDALNHWLWNPRKFAPGTIMAFAGIPKDQERANVIAYLNSEGSNQPYPKPSAPAAEAPKEAEAGSTTATNAKPASGAKPEETEKGESKKAEPEAGVSAPAGEPAAE